MTIDELIDVLQDRRPSYDLDRAIADLVDPNIERFGIRMEQHMYGPDGDFVPAGVVRDLTPSFTGSIDAAMALIPPGWLLTKLFQFREYSTRKPFGWGAVLNPESAEEDGFEWAGQADTPAIALCIAALEARKHISEKEPANGR